MDYVIGIDGGGTKTQCAVFDTDGNKIDFLNWGPLNHEVLDGGLKEFEDEINRLFDSILEKNNIAVKDIKKGVFGMAGVDTRKQHAVISDMILKAGIKNIILCNDAFLGVKAGCSTGYGICVINGTGCSVAGINSKGEMLQIGGQGPMTGDKGGGSQLGIMAISAIYNNLFRCGRYTLMKDLLFEDLGIGSKYDFMDIITQKMNDRTLNISEVNKYVFNAANMQDEVACGILEDTGMELGLSVNGMIGELEFQDAESIEIVLAGSVNVKGDNPVLIDSLKRQVLSRNPDKSIGFTLLDKPPVAGAIVWALEGNTGKTGMYGRVVEQF